MSPPSHPDCLCSLVPLEPESQSKSVAECLLQLAHAIKHPAHEVIGEFGEDDDGRVARVKLALDLDEPGRRGLALRAMVEDWSMQRIVREVY